MSISPTSCRLCNAPLSDTFVDLGLSPISNAMRLPSELCAPEVHYPLHAMVCASCKLVQLSQNHQPSDLFHNGYTYFSSYSQSWLDHAKAYVEHVMKTYKLGQASFAVEVASNDGYLLQYFRPHGIRTLGIEPSANVAEVAIQERGVPTLIEFFGRDTALTVRAQHGPANLITANNVMAHVPDLNDFVGGFAALLADTGVITVEFPHLLALIENTYFDTIYHEHYSYFSLLAAERLMARHALQVFDVQELSTHGGSLRIHVTHEKAQRPPSEALRVFRAREVKAKLDTLDTYRPFSDHVRACKRNLLATLIELKNRGHSIVAYGAPAKGNTLLNYCGIGTDFIDYTVDASPHKQSLYLPGTGLPVYAPERIRETRPDYILILPWNLKDEIAAKLQDARSWGAKFITPLPTPQIF
jgi:C-methyltransferase C-terminal domain/Putative zinc binding domain/Methyltransferase domain